MTKIKQSPKMPAEKRREQLLKAAEKVIGKKGYRHTTLEEIARQAKLTKGAIYFHFKNKEDIFFELVKRVTSRNFEMFAALQPDSVTPPDFLGLMFEGKGKNCIDVGDLGSNLDFWVQAINVPRIKKYLNTLDEEFFEVFDRVVDPRYLADRTKSRHMAVMTLALVDGLMVRGILNPPTVDFSAQISLLKEMYEAWLDKQSVAKLTKK